MAKPTDLSDVDGPRPDTSPTGWLWSDAWILASLPDDSSATLSDLIASADCCNHAIPTRDELAGALGRLVGAGLVDVSDNGFRVTNRGVAVKKHWKGGLFGWDSLMPHLQKLDATAGEYPLTDAQVDSAYTAYRQHARR